MKNRDGRKLPKSTQQELRIRGVEYWRKCGSLKVTSENLSIPYITIRKWVKRYQEEGKGSLDKDNRGRPAGKELDSRMEKRIQKMLIEKTPDQLKFSFGLWTRETVAELIKRETGISRSVWQIGRYLKEWGFTPQKPVYRAYERNNKAVNEWLNESYPLLKASAKECGATIFWGDETGIRSTDQRGRGYSPKGQTPVVRKTGKQFGITMLSAVNNRGKLFFMLSKKAVNSAIFIRFMKRLVKSYKGKLFLIVDNLPAHKTKLVTKWVEENKERISIFYLPAYSPDLNPDEYLNQDLKVSITGKIEMTSPEDIKKGVRSFMNKRKRNPQQVKKYFHHPCVKYAA